MTSFHLVNVWTEPEAGAGGFNPMASSFLWLPDGYRPGEGVRGFVFVHRWGGYPYDPIFRQLGPALADQGFACLSVCLRRRGMEGQLTALPDNDLRDVKLAVDFLQTNGCDEIFIAGHEVGALSALRYQSKTRDTRVKGIALLEPVDDPAIWLRNCVGADEYDAAIQRAGIAVRQSAGMDVRIDLLPDNGPRVTQNSPMFLAWWGPMADTRSDSCLADITVPLLAIANNEADLPESLGGESSAGKLPATAFGGPETWAGKLIDWAGGLARADDVQIKTEVVCATSAGEELFGLLWTQAGEASASTAIMLVHGLTSSPLSPLFGKMAPVLARSNAAVLAIETHRSGFWGHETALLDQDIDAIDAWIDVLNSRGYERIILAGASMGSLSIGRYQSVRQHPAVIALAHLMPTADCPDWFRRASGDGPYLAAVSQAEKALAEGCGNTELIDIDVRQPAPSLFGSRFRWTQRASSWLSWWGPDADSANTRHIANARVPILLLSGTDDSYNDEARFAELKAAAVNAPSVEEIWYPNVDHGLAGVEAQVARDLIAWLEKIGLL